MTVLAGERRGLPLSQSAIRGSRHLQNKVSFGVRRTGKHLLLKKEELCQLMRARHRVGSGIPRWALREKCVPGGPLAGCVSRAVVIWFVCAGLLVITTRGYP